MQSQDNGSILFNIYKLCKCIVEDTMFSLNVEIDLLYVEVYESYVAIDVFHGNMNTLNKLKPYM